MITFFLQILCSFLISMSLVFIVIEIRARFDKSFLIFGIANLLLCSFSAIDIWLQPTTMVVNWTRIQHVIASFFPPCILWYLMLSVKKENINIIRWLFIVATLVSLTFFTDAMLLQDEKYLKGSVLYNFLFVPYMLFSIIGILITSIGFSKKGTAYQRRFLLWHFIGAILLSVSGIIDMSCVLYGARIISSIPGFTIVGILCFSSVVNVLFIDKLTVIIHEREETFEKLRNAYQELEESQALKELGQSTAMINHEIRNYAVAISGYAEMLHMKGDLNEFSEKMVRRITDSVDRMANFSKDILEFSRSSVIKKSSPFNLYNVITKCIENNFEKNSDKFVTDFDVSCQFIISGDWHKLDQVFFNLFKNAFEAGAMHIIIRLWKSGATVRCQISDDGSGCDDEVIMNLFKAFHTTKKMIGGTGLGMSVVKSIVEGHRGRISAFSKTHTKGVKGLGLNIVFPAYNEFLKTTEEEKNGILFIAHGINDLTIPLRIFRNALVNPYIFNDVKDIDSDFNFKNIYALIGGTESIHHFKSRFKTDFSLYALVEEVNTGLFILDARGEDEPIIFSEEYLLSRIVASEYEKKNIG